MRNLFIVLAVVVGSITACEGQTAEQALAQYQAALPALHTVAYRVQRIDTFPGNGVWNHKGQAIMQRDAASPILAARFLATQFDASYTYRYDGKNGYELDDKAKTFVQQNNPGMGILGGPGGQILVEELLAIEPGYESVTYQTGPLGPVLRLHYPNLPKVDIRNRYTYLVFDETTKRPKMVRTVCQKAGGKSSIIKLLTDVRVNDAHDEETLASTLFLTAYKAAAPEAPRQPPALLGKPAPGFELTTFIKAPVALSSYRGKTVLLDFWTTWCSPCIASMPNMQRLQDSYRNQGLVVVSVLMDPKSATRAQGILKRQGASYTALLGSKDVERVYGINAYPRYVLVDKSGQVTFDESGEGAQLETAIKAALKK